MSVFSDLTFGASVGEGRAVHLRLIETTDLHLHLLPWDYFSACPQEGVGLAAAAGVIEAARAEAPNALLFDNGDFLQGTPMADFLAQHGGLKPGETHPAIAAMAALGYDAITLGNHEFNYGLGFLERVLADAPFPVVSANLAHRLGGSPREDRLLVKPYVLLDRMVTDQTGGRHPIRIGVIGFAPPQVVDWDRHHLEGALEGRDMVEAARAWVPEMREAGADVILALAHTGIGAARHTYGMENAAVPLARLAGIDALMTGHSHLLFPSPVFHGFQGVDPVSGTIAGVPAVMGGWRGAHVGLIDLLLTRDGGRWQVLGARSEVRAAPVTKEAARRKAPAGGAEPEVPPPGAGGRVYAAVARAHQQTLAAFGKAAGRTEIPLHSYFVHLGETAALALVGRAKAAHVRERLADPGLRALPLLASVAPFKAGGLAGPRGYTDVPEGTLVQRHLADLYAFPNALTALKLSGAQVLEWLERSASAYNRIAPGSTETPLRNPGVAGYQFEVIEPVEVVYDLTRPARYDIFGAVADPRARRVVSARFEGREIDPRAEFILCTNSFRLNGAAGFVDRHEAEVVMNDGTVAREALRRYVGHHLVTHGPEGAVRFAPIPGTHALFETGPGALAHLHEIARYMPELRGSTHSGFLRIRVDLSGKA